MFNEEGFVKESLFEHFESFEAVRASSLFETETQYTIPQCSSNSSELEEIKIRVKLAEFLAKNIKLNIKKGYLIYNPYYIHNNNELHLTPKAFKDAICGKIVGFTL